MIVDPVEIKALREVLGLARQGLADRLEVNLATVARIERHGVSDDGPDVELLGRLKPLLRAAGIVPLGLPESEVDEDAMPTPPPSDPPVDEFDSGRTVSTEWRGLRRGNVIEVRGYKGLLIFGHHVATASQEYISAYATRNGGERSFAPDRVIIPEAIR